jgi:hypothetical protein
VSLSQQHSNVVFLKVDIDECRSIAQELGIRSVPSFKFYRNSSVIDQVSGADLTSLTSKINALKGSGGGWSGSGFRTLGSAAASSASTVSADDAVEARRRAAEAAARRFAATTASVNVEDLIDAEVGTRVSNAIPAADREDVDTCATAGAGNTRRAQPVTQVFVEQLIEMGFSRGLATRALQESNNQSVEGAIIWYAQNEQVSKQQDSTGLGA